MDRAHLTKLSAEYLAVLKKDAPFFTGETVYGRASVYECPIEGDMSPLILVIDGIAYSSGEYELSDLRY